MVSTRSRFMSSLAFAASRRGGVAVIGAFSLALLVEVLPARAEAAPVLLEKQRNERDVGEPQKPLEAKDAASAQVTAKLRGRRAEDVSARTESSSTFANPDGSWTTEAFGGPVRFRDAAGRWQDIDLTLVRRSDGSIAPAAHPRGLVLAASTKGKSVNRSLFAVGRGDTETALSWTGKLPEPVLEGSRATYRDVLPGTDLVMEATTTGVEQFFVVRSRPAKEPSPFRLTLASRGLDISQPPGGGLELKNAAGEVVATVPAPYVWDATIDPASGESSNRAPLQMSVTAVTPKKVTVTLSAPAGYFTDPATVFPVTVDPSVTLRPSFDTFVQSDYSSDQSGSTELKVGSYNGSVKARSYLTFPLGSVKGTVVSAATLKVWLKYTSSCSPVAMNVHSADPASTSSRWTNRPAIGTSWGAASNPPAGRGSSCANPNGVWMSKDVKSMVQSFANGTSSKMHLALMSANESSVHSWKRMNSNEAASGRPYISVTYNSYPRTPGTPTHVPGTSSATTTTGWTNTTTPTLRATVDDPDGSSRALFDVYQGSTLVISKLAGSYVTRGGTSTAVVPASKLVNGQQYVVYAWGNDGTLTSKYRSAGYDRFTVDTTPPTAPTVSSTEFPENEWSTNLGGNGKADFTAKATSGDAVTLRWSLDGGTWSSQAVSGTATTATISLPKPPAGKHTLAVTTLDAAGNVGTTRTYVFFYGTGVALAAIEEAQVTARRLPLDVQVDPDLTSTIGTLSFQYRRGESDTWRAIPLSDVYKPDNTPVGTAWPGLNTTTGRLSSGTLAWDAANTLSGAGVIDVRVVFSNATYTAETVTATVDTHAGGMAAASVGPGSLNLQTGEFTLDSSDTSFFGSGIGRAYGSRSLNAATEDGAAGAFGPQWSSNVGVLGGSAFVTARKTSNTSLDLVSGDGHITSFTLKAGTSDTWEAPPGLEGLVLRGSLTAATLTLTDAAATVTTFQAQGVAGTWQAVAVDPTGAENTAMVSWRLVDSKLRLARIVGPNAALTAEQLATCATATTPGRGCRVLELVWGSVTLSSGATAARVTAVKTWAWDPITSLVRSTTTATYGYDGRGWLTSVTDPRTTPALSTRYGYDSAGRVSSLTPPGQQPWTFVYAGTNGAIAGPVWDRTDAVAAGATGTATSGRLVQVSRPTLTSQTANTVNGTATTSVVYGVPLTSTVGPATMTASAVSAWGQTSIPTDATAVYDADVVQSDFWALDDATNRATWDQATVEYLDVNGQTTNVRERGGYLDATNYDIYGNDISHLSPLNRALAVTTTQHPVLDELGLAAADSRSRAQMLSEIYGYAPGTVDAAAGISGGLRPAWTQGPVHTAVLADGSITQVRATTRYVYDTGRPAGSELANLVTSEQSGALRPGADPAVAPLDDQREVTSTYDWSTGAVLATTVDPSPADADEIVRRSSYDEQGRPVTEVQPKGGAAGTRTTTYYDTTAPAGCTTSAAAPEFDGLVCRTATGALTGGANPQQVTTSYAYNRVGAVRSTTEGANGATRTTVVDYDAADRPTRVTVTGSGLGTGVPAQNFTYNADSGALQTTSGVINGMTRTITQLTDGLGRPWRYSESSGSITGLTTTAGYDRLDRPATAVLAYQRPIGTSTFTISTTYSASSGLPTTINDTSVGQVRFGFDVGGNHIQTTYDAVAARGLIMKQLVTSTGEPIEREWTATDSDDATARVQVGSESVVPNSHGQWSEHSTMASGQRRYRYDKAGRLTSTSELAGGECALRSYAFDQNGNRTGESYLYADATTGPAGDHTVCPTPATPARTHSYDLADRLVDAGHVYDAFGRTTRLPLPGGQVQRVAYHVNDLVAAQRLYASPADADANGGAGQNPLSVQTYTLDIVGDRILSTQTSTTALDEETNQPITTTVDRTHRYSGPDDSPAFTDEDVASGNAPITRNIAAGPAGFLAAVSVDKATGSTSGLTWNISTLGGDIAFAMPADVNEPVDTLSTDEYGLPTSSAAVGARYAWLGAEQRAADTPAGTYLMGVRLYNPNSGRFLSVDPVFGGNENAYNYPNDPVNLCDPDGTFGRLVKWTLKAVDWAMGQFEKLCAKIPHPMLSIGCTIAVGGTRGVIGYLLSMNALGKRWTMLGGIIAFGLGAGGSLLRRYGKWLVRFLYHTWLGRKVRKQIRRVRALDKIVNGVVRRINKND